MAFDNIRYQEIKWWSKFFKVFNGYENIVGNIKKGRRVEDTKLH